jgi:hypothetical protein
MITVPVITSMVEIIIIFIPFLLTILLLSKPFPMAHGHIIKINIIYIRIISHKLIYIGVNLPNNPPNIKFSLLIPILNPTMIISMLPLQHIIKFIGHLIHPLIHNLLLSYNFIFLFYSAMIV